MAQEIERKFLVSGEGWKAQAESAQKLVQGYLPLEQPGELRVRLVNDDSAVLTIKSEGGLVRQETEVAIDRHLGETMLKSAKGIILEKTRYRVPAEDGLVFEVDVYSGALDGFVVAEIELPTENTPVPHRGWLGLEVTEDKAYKNKSLAANGLPKAPKPRGPRFG